MKSKNKFFLYVLILIIMGIIGLSFAVPNIYAQTDYSFYSSYMYYSLPIGVTPQLTLTNQYVPYYTPSFSNPYFSSGVGQIVPTVIPSTTKTAVNADFIAEPIDAVSEIIQINAPENGELTGEMMVKFDADKSPYPENYNFYFDGSRIYKDIKAYVTSLVNCTDNKTDAEAIYSFKISRWGIYKISNLVWAKDCGHDSFFVEIKRGDTRVPFPATNYNGGFYLVKTAHDRYEFNPKGQYNTWHWQDVCHWNAYYKPYERAVPCIYLLRPGSYKLIYRAREASTRLAAIKIVRLRPIIAPADDTDLEKFESDTVQEYFEGNFKEDSISLEPSLPYDETIEMEMEVNTQM
ncbi:MAG: hypothetical protein ACMUHX_11245 [bacterium]